MDDFFGTVIYIVISIAIFAISALGKRKKRLQKQGQPVQNNKPEPSIFEQLFEERNQEPVYQESQVNYNEPIEYIEEDLFEDEPVVEEKVEKQPYSIEYDQSKRASQMVQNEENLFDGIKDGEISKTNEDQNDTGGFKFEDFDLEEAIVYSEIMNRKYV